MRSEYPMGAVADEVGDIETHESGLCPGLVCLLYLLVANNGQLPKQLHENINLPLLQRRDLDVCFIPT
jgi:hypothetical protein